MQRKTSLMVLITLLTACAGYRPVVDMQGVDAAPYEADLRDCQQYAQQRDPATRARLKVALVGSVSANGLVLGRLG